MDPQTQAQLQQVRKFSRNARTFCVFLFACLTLMSLWVLSNVLGPPATTNFVADLGPYSISASALVTQKTVYSTATPYGIAGPELPSFITAALLLLSSWIMDVGRQTKDEAEELRREADLVV